jgi:fluoride exporter
MEVIMINLLYVAFGGAIGAGFRYFLKSIIFTKTGDFPWSTFVINLTGSFLIGLLWGLSRHFSISENVKVFLFAGILSSFTTFSAFSLENLQMIQEGKYLYTGLYICASVFIGLLACGSGLYLSGKAI